MSGNSKEMRGRKRRGEARRQPYGAADRAAVVRALGRGASMASAAWQIGCDRTTIYNWRRKFPEFDEACARAMKEGERPMVIEPNGGRRLQMRPQPRNRFSLARKETFLDHFAATCDATAAAELAGVARSTPIRHRRRDPAFREAWDEALAQGYARLEAEAVRLRLAALERIRIEGDKDVPEAAAEFDRALALLREAKRQTGKPSGRERAPKAWDFDRALDELEKELKALGVRIDKEEEEEEEGEADD
jgi:transposase